MVFCHFEVNEEFRLLLAIMCWKVFPYRAQDYFHVYVTKVMFINNNQKQIKQFEHLKQQKALLRATQN